MLQQPGIVDASVAERRLLGDRIHAVRRCDERGAVGRDEPALHRAAGFHQLGSEHHVDVAGQRHQREHRLAAVALGHGAREQLDVVDGGAGALRHAGHRRGLREVPVGLAEVDDPVGQHAAALAPHRQDGDLDRRHDDPPSDEYVGRPPEGARAGLGAARRSARLVWRTSRAT